MALVDELDADLRRAMKARDRFTVDAIRMLKTKIVARSTASKRQRLEADDELVRDAIVAYRNEMTRTLRQYASYGDRGFEHADQLVHEIGVCERYVPPLLDQAAVRALVRDAIASGLDRVGEVVGHVMRAHRHEVLGDDVVAIARELMPRDSVDK